MVSLHTRSFVIAQDSTLNGQQWGEGMDAYFALMLRQSPKVADELRPLLLRFALWTLK